MELEPLEKALLKTVENPFIVQVVGDEVHYYAEPRIGKMLLVKTKKAANGQFDVYDMDFVKYEDFQNAIPVGRC